MAANEFEKSVRKIMDEFKLHPSDDVWQNVEERIRERNRKRRILFILFCFFGLVLAGSGLYIFSNSQAANSNNKSGNSKQRDVTVSATNSPTKNDSVKISAPQENAIGRQLLPEETNPHENSTQKNRTGTRNHVALGSYDMKKQNLKATNFSSPNKKHEDGSVIVETSRRKLNDVFVDKTKILSDTQTQKFIATEPQESIQSNISSDTTQLKHKQSKPSESAVQTTKPKNNEKTSMKLKWGINISVGSSSLAENRLSFDNSSRDKSYFASSPGNSPGGQPVTSSIHSQPGFAFKAGAIAKTSFSVRSSVATGLNYVYFSDEVRVGVQQNAPVQLPGAYNVFSYYAGSPQKDFTEHFHFVELPILYNWRMTRNEKHFLSLDAGISIAYLISTNALIYDTASGGIYYHNKDLITKTHFNIIPGISYHAINPKGLEFSVGPQFAFDMTKAIKSDLDKRNYFLYIGLNASLFFEKKKK